MERSLLEYSEMKSRERDAKKKLRYEEKFV